MDLCWLLLEEIQFLSVDFPLLAMSKSYFARFRFKISEEFFFPFLLSEYDRAVNTSVVCIVSDGCNQYSI